MRLVVDASVAVKWFLVAPANEPWMTEAEAVAAMLDQPETQLLAPPHWIPEILGVLARVEPKVVNGAIIDLHDIRAKVISEPIVLIRAAGLAIELNHHLFDTLYHAVALEYDATLVTADDRYFAKAQGQGRIVLLKDFAPPA